MTVLSVRFNHVKCEPGKGCKIIIFLIGVFFEPSNKSNEIAYMNFNL